MERDAKRPIDGEKADESEGFDKEERQPLFSDAITQDLRHATGVENVGRFQKKPRVQDIYDWKGVLILCDWMWGKLSKSRNLNIHFARICFMASLLSLTSLGQAHPSELGYVS